MNACMATDQCHRTHRTVPSRAIPHFSPLGCALLFPTSAKVSVLCGSCREAMWVPGVEGRPGVA